MSIIVAGFPGVGKTFLSKSFSGVVDCDSRHFRWEDSSMWPGNYLGHITMLSQIPQISHILVHPGGDVLRGLRMLGLPFVLVYPALDIQDAYIQRHRDQGIPEDRISILESLYAPSIRILMAQKDCEHVVLQQGQYLMDVIDIGKGFSHGN